MIRSFFLLFLMSEVTCVFMSGVFLCHFPPTLTPTPVHQQVFKHVMKRTSIVVRIICLHKDIIVIITINSNHVLCVTSLSAIKNGNGSECHKRRARWGQTSITMSGSDRWREEKGLETEYVHVEYTSGRCHQHQSCLYARRLPCLSKNAFLTSFLTFFRSH